MTVVWRIEHYETQIGPYNSIYSPFKDWYSTDRWPSPQNDNLPHPWRMPEEFRYGFKSLQQVNEWFTPTERELLRRQGFRLKKYTAAEILIGGKQVAFLPETSQ